jgi:hypothetical protein
VRKKENFSKQTNREREKVTELLSNRDKDREKNKKTEE